MNESSADGLKKNKIVKKRIIIISMIIILVISDLCFFYLGNKFAFTGLGLKGIKHEVAEDLKSIEDTEKYELLFKVRDIILTKYDGEIDDEKLLQGAIKGMTLALQDPYTVFMNAEEYKAFAEQSEGHFVGIGAQLGIKEEKVMVVAPIEGSPADKAGLKAGDVLLKVNDEPIEDPNLEKIIASIRGEEGTEVKLTIQRDGNENPIDIKIVRGIVDMVAVKGEMIDNSIGYIQISSFDENVAKDFEEKISELKSSGMKGLILDLRGNPGGFLGESVKVASQFIPKGEIITYTIDKYDKKVESKSVGGVAEGMPLVILIDGGSASASEVVTGALRDYGVATTVGLNTFGKGVVQQLIEVDNGLAAIKVTTSRYYTPNGENIHGTGIKPDIEVKIPEELLEGSYNRSVDPQFNKALEVISEKLK